MNLFRWNPFLRRPVLSLAVTLAAVLPLLAQWPRVRVNSETEVLLAGDERNLASYERAKKILAGVDVTLVSLRVEEVFSQAGLDAVRRVSEAFEGLPGVESVKSLTHSERPVRRGFSFEMVPLVPPGRLGGLELRRLREYCLEHPLIRNVMVAPDSRHTLITVSWAGGEDGEGVLEIGERVRRVLAPFRKEGLQFRVLGLPLVEEEVRADLIGDFWRFLPAALGLLVMILWVTFRSWRILGMILAHQLALLALFPGVVIVAGFSLTVFTVMLIPLLAGVQLVLLAHVFAAWQRAAARGLTGEEAIRGALSAVWTASVYAAVTTALGLASLGFADVSQVREFGWLGAMGVGLIFFLIFGPGVAWMRLGLSASIGGAAGIAGEPKEMEGRAAADGWSGRMAGLARRRAGTVLLMALGAAGVAFFGARQIRTDIRAAEFLNPRSPTRLALEELDAIYGGINVVQIEFDSGAENGINRLGFLRYLERVQQEAAGRAEVSGAYSYAQLLGMMNQIWEQDRAGSLKMPENAWLIQVFALALKSRDFPFLSALSDPSGRAAYLVVRTRDMPSETYLELIRSIVSSAERDKPPEVRVSAAEGLHSILEADRRILRSQLRSGGASLALIGLLLAALWRSPRLALMAVVVNALPVGLGLAAAGVLGIPLNSITIMVAAIAFGIAVDDSIHFITHWRKERLTGASALDGARSALREKGRPIVSTSLILAGIGLVLCLSSFPPVAHFGLLWAIVFLCGLMSVLCLLPALLCRFGDGGRGR